MSLAILANIRNYAIIFAYLILFGTASWDKVRGLKTPDWFVSTFQKTILGRLPGGPAFGFWMIAILESFIFLTFLGSLFSPALLPIALIASLFLFGILCFGLRITQDFQGSANMFIYIGATLIALLHV